MTYIIQNRIVRILYNDRDFSNQLKQLFSQSAQRASETNYRNTIIIESIWSI
jgi:NhaP-type Na+/H+ and K+/H+ antiporter